MPGGAAGIHRATGGQFIRNGSGPDSAGDTIMRKVSDTDPTTLYVFKTMVDPFAGRISFFKVISGSVRTDASVENYNRSENERMAHLAIMQGGNS